jgi:hypothetical protein
VKKLVVRWVVESVDWWDDYSVALMGPMRVDRMDQRKVGQRAVWRAEKTVERKDERRADELDGNSAE